MTLDIIRNFNRIFNDSFYDDDFFRPSFLTTPFTRTDYLPAFRAEDKEDAYTVSAVLPGIKKENVKAEFKDQMLKISVRNDIQHEEKADYHLQERRSTRFERSVHIPYSIDAENISAAFENGLLTVTLPKSEEHKPQKIAIN